MAHYEKLLAAIKTSSQLRNLIDFVENEGNRTDLVFDLQQGSLGTTQLMIEGQDISTISDIRGYVKERGGNALRSLSNETMTIKISINASMASLDAKMHPLQVMAHEWAIHAMQMPAFIVGLRKIASGGVLSEVSRYIEDQHFHLGIHGGVSAVHDHARLVFGQNEAYNLLVEILKGSGILNAQEVEAFKKSYEADIKTYAVNLLKDQDPRIFNFEESLALNADQIKQQLDVDRILGNYKAKQQEMSQLLEKASVLTEAPSFAFKKKTSAPQTQTPTQPQKKDEKTSAQTQKQTPTQPQEKVDCFITTACTVARGLPDDCHELTTLRRFRDEYVRAQPGGLLLIRDYYRVAPRIVAAISGRDDAQRIFDGLFEVVQGCVRAIEDDAAEEALDRYGAMVLGLRHRYAID